jgi:HEAT repeat protein
VAAVAELAGATWAQGATAPFDVLAFALADEERSVQLAAARALGRLCVRATEGLSSPPPPRSERDIASGRLRLHQPRASDVLELVGRSQDDDLLAATVRALADAAALSSRSLAPPPSPRIGATTTSEVEELIAALAPLANSAPSPVAIAAVEALARAPAEERGRLDALIGALDHSDHGVVEATVLKLRVAATDGSRDGRAIREALTRCLRHSSPEVRTLATEGLGGSTPPGSGDGPGRGGRGRG